MSYDFDAIDTVDNKRNDKPIWAMDLDSKNEKPILDWLNVEFRYLEKANEDRIRTIKHNIARFKGIQYQAMDTRAGNRDREQERAKFSPKLVVNLLANATEQRVSRLVKYKPAVAILPANDEHSDKVASKNAKTLLDYIQYSQKFEAKNQRVLRIAEICGEGYLDIVWNPDLGSKHPDFTGEPQPLLDENGAEVKGDDGKPVMIEEAVHIGDVEYKVLLPLHLFFEKAESFETADYCFKIEKVQTEKLRKEYSDKATDIKSDGDKTFYDLTTLEDERLHGETLKITFQHKKTKYMPEGRYIVFTKDVILENGPCKYEHGDFSFERMPGVEIPGEQHAVSFFQNCKAINAQYNNLTNMIVRNQALVAHPKWFVPRGSVKLESLGNDITIAQYQGGQAPVLAQQNPTPVEVFNFRESLKEEFRQQAGLGDVTSGEPPTGIKAGVALQFLAEQEAQIANSQVVNYNEYIRRVADKTLKVAGQYYDPSDRRTVMALGQNKNWTSINFDPQHLTRAFDIRIQNAGALPDSKAARTQTILDMSERFPNLFPQEQIVEMLDLGQTEKFMDEAAAAARSAEAENERIMNGEQVEPPAEFEHHIVHWRVHFKAMQDPTFKSAKLPEEIRQAMIDHMLATEMLLEKSAIKSPALQQELAMLPGFPIFWVPAPPPPPMMPPPMEGEAPPPALIPSDMQPPDQLPPNDLQAQMPPEVSGAPVEVQEQGFAPV